MKVLITTDAFSPMINGVVTSTMNLYEELTNLGHDVRILALANDHHSRRVGNVYYIHSFGVSFYPNARATVVYRNRYIDEIMEWQPDIIHTQTEFCTFFIAKRIARKLNIPMVHTYHTMYEHYTNYFIKSEVVGHKAVVLFSKEIIKNVEAVIAPTIKTKNTLEQYGIHTHIEVIPTGLKLDRFQEKMSSEERSRRRKELGISDKDKVLITVGRLGSEKNIDEILANMVEVLKEHKDIKMLIVGDGPHREALQEEAERLQIADNVIFTGMVPIEEVHNYYKLGDIFVSASISETQGLTYIEALISGLPLLCRQDDCLNGVLIEGENGFAYNTKEECLAYLKKLLNDEALCARLSVNAAEGAEKFSAKAFGESAVALYERVIDNYKKENNDLENTMSM